MSQTTVSTPVVDTPVNLADLSTAQLSERMGELANRHDELKASVTEFEQVKTDLASTLAEFQKRMGSTVAVSPKKETAPRQPRAKREDGKYPSLKDIVLNILSKNADGLELKGIVAEVQGMINRNEYASTAKSLSAVVSQAVNALKQESLIDHDRESKKYTRTQAAA